MILSGGVVSACHLCRSNYNTKILNRPPPVLCVSHIAAATAGIEVRLHKRTTLCVKLETELHSENNGRPMYTHLILNVR